MNSSLCRRFVSTKQETSIFNMARFLILAFLVATAVVVMAAPAEEYEPLEVAAEEYNNQAEEAEHLRFRRVTCDLLSATGMVADTACAANCLSMGKAGGSCNGGICVCRKDSFKDLWDKRFG